MHKLLVIPTKIPPTNSHPVISKVRRQKPSQKKLRQTELWKHKGEVSGKPRREKRTAFPLAADRKSEDRVGGGGLLVFSDGIMGVPLSNRLAGPKGREKQKKRKRNKKTCV